jgi:acetyltransferase-like isoleucine patch superfamily enzyme
MRPFKARQISERAVNAARVARASALFSMHGLVYEGRPKIAGRRPLISCQGSMVVGRSLFIRSNQFRVQLTVGSRGTLRIGDGVFINQGVNIYAEQSIIIGDNVLFADLAAVYDTDFHAVAPDRPTRVAPVVIEDNAWIGRSATILAGVTVGRHSVVAAGAVVTRSVPPQAIVAGSPAKVIDTFRCDPDYIRR